jgi:hypothetical protein
MDKQNIDKIDQLLDEQAAKFPTGVDVAKAKKGVPIKMLSTDIEFLSVNGINSGIIVCAIAVVDGIHYAALYDPRSHKGYVEEVHMTPGKTAIQSTQLIKDPLEWNILSEFFNRHNVFEMKRIFNWAMAMKNGTVGSTPGLQNWMNRINSGIRAAGTRIRPYTMHDFKALTNRFLNRMINKKKK